MPGWYQGELQVGNTYFVMGKDEARIEPGGLFMVEEPVIEPEGIFGKWIWAFRSLLQ